jgi:hypothetical protein
MKFLGTLTAIPAVLRCAVLAAIGVIAVSSASAADIGSHLMAYYRLDGDAVDGSGRGHDGIVMGPTSTTDRFGAANSATPLRWCRRHGRDQLTLRTSASTNR